MTFTAKCDTMTFEDAYNKIMNGEPINFVANIEFNGRHGLFTPLGISAYNNSITMSFDANKAMLETILWSADGFEIKSLGPF